MATKSPVIPKVPLVQEPDRDEGGAVVLERRTQKTKPPHMYQVLEPAALWELRVIWLPCFHSIERTAALRCQGELVTVCLDSSSGNKKTAHSRQARAVWIPERSSLTGSKQAVLTCCRSSPGRIQNN